MQPPLSRLMSFSGSQANFSPAVRQFSIYSPNRVGQLNEMLHVLDSEGVCLLGITCIDLTDGVIWRCIPNYPDALRRLLHQMGITWSEQNVLVISLEDALKLRVITALLLQGEVSIHYMYALLCAPEGAATLALSVDEPQIACQILKNHHIRLLSESDLAR